MRCDERLCLRMLMRAVRHVKSRFAACDFVRRNGG